MNTIRNVLIANRGEIALRIARGVSDYGAGSIAIYADQDIDSQFVSAADKAYALSGATAEETYLDQDKIISIAQKAGADAIHPGYGFLSENPDFVTKVMAAGITWVGPKPESILALGDKVQARKVATEAKVPTIPGTNHTISSKAEVEKFVSKHGYPIILKMADGGGGRGINVIEDETALDHFFLGRDEKTLTGFFIERFVQKARHIETQCGRDQHGNFVVYSTRDCSVQRRNQKLIEEAPAPNLDSKTLATIVKSSKKLFESVDYLGLGTCEFLLDQNGEVYFLEVNPRLQVEHTVTEEVTGIDLVRQQLLIAEGKTIDDTEIRGHSFEFRITSEDPYAGLTPTLGSLEDLQWPAGPGIRIDTGVRNGDKITPDFDSMIAKLIVTGENRKHALARAKRALAELKVSGVNTPIPLYQEIIKLPEFNDDELKIWTNWLEAGFLEDFMTKAPKPETPAHKTAANALLEKAKEMMSFIVEFNGQRHELALPTNIFGTRTHEPATTTRPTQPLRSSRKTPSKTLTTTDPNVINSDMQAMVVRVPIESGAKVNEGDLVMVLESMKMEKYVHAHRAGVIEEILVKAGDKVSRDQTLIKLEAEKSDHKE
ncbi:MAG: biotin carboxylase N-terminal domain-containing protein [Micrococcaceae bacterium]